MELKPCPFCGGKANITDDCDDDYFVFCLSCSVQTPIFELATHAILVWNNRVGETYAIGSYDSEDK
jgi:Lar family restriction alleviation protein